MHTVTLTITEILTLGTFILLHPLDPFLENAKMILPLGHPYCEGKCALVLNVSMDRDKHYFKKATALFEEKDDSFEDTPMYQWHPGLSEGEWTFEFMDAEGMGWNFPFSPSDTSQRLMVILAGGNPAGICSMNSQRPFTSF